MLFLHHLTQDDGNPADFNVFSAKRTQFSDVFSNSDSSKFEDLKQQTRTVQYCPSKADASVANCLFHDCSSSSNGGAVSCSSSIERIFIEETTFTTCRTTNYYGGGIYFNNTNNGECVIFHTCALNCSSTCSGRDYSRGQYAFIRAKNTATSKNEVNETTIAGIKSKETSHHALELSYSNIICSSVNITNNECYCRPALSCCPTYLRAICTCCIIYTSIVNNSASSHGCMLFENSGSTQMIYTSNIINNKEVGVGEGTIYSTTNLFINESCIIGNMEGEGKRVFYECGGSCQIMITNCTLDSDIITQSTRYSGTFKIISTKESSFINALSHIVTGKCMSSFDTYGTLTAASKGSSKRISRTNDVFLRLLQYLCIIFLLPSLSTKRYIESIDVGFRSDH